MFYELIVGGAVTDCDCPASYIRKGFLRINV
jgi:hypothetical protein